ncbi:MAG: hypothetical protein Kow00129_07080 [Thermoleophilia bacterium]
MSAQKSSATRTVPKTGGTKPTRIRSEIDAGICGFHTTVLAEAVSMREVHLDITSDCPAIRKAAEQLKEIDMLEETKSGMGRGAVYEVLSGCARHVACPVGAGILKAAEAASGLALPKDATIRVSKETATEDE